MLLLYRYEQATYRTHGILLLDSKFVADTLELPWRENKRNESSIPCGLYRIRWNIKSHNWPCYEVEEVQGREGILIHPANAVSELEGCIALGTKWGDQVSNSGAALMKLHDLAGDHMSLLVVDKFGG